MWKQISPSLKIETSKPLGQGGFATVYKGIYNNSQEVAVKELKRFIGNNNVNQYFETEIEITQKQINNNNPYLVKIIDVIPPYSFFQQNQNDIEQQRKQEQQSAYIVMELCNGDLRRFIKSNPKNDILQLIFIIRAIMEGVKQLHEQNIIHRDLKPENIFTVTALNTNQIYYKVGDFGLGKNQDVANTQIGTIVYMAPEMLNFNSFNYTNKIDIWALGVILHELLTGVNIFQGFNVNQIRNNIIQFKSYLAKRQESLQTININSDPIIQSYKLITRQEVANLIDAMLQPIPEQRLDIQGICDLCDQTIVALQKPIDDTIGRAGNGAPGFSNFQAPNVYKAPQNQLKPQGLLNSPAVLDYVNQISQLKGKIGNQEAIILKLNEGQVQQQKQYKDQIEQKEQQILRLNNEIVILKNQQNLSQSQITELEAAKKELEKENQQLILNQIAQQKSKHSQSFEINFQNNSTSNEKDLEQNIVQKNTTNQNEKKEDVENFCCCIRRRKKNNNQNQVV